MIGKKEGGGKEVEETKVSGIGLAIALGVHSIFEGMMLGMMTKVEDAGSLATGLLIHKAAEVFSLGGNLAAAGYDCK